MNKYYKNIFMILITIIATIFMGVNVANAESASSKLRIGSSNYTKTPLKFPQTFHVKKTTGGKYAYCTTYASNRPNTSIKYIKGSAISNNGINYILREAKKNVNSSKDFFVYQTALWVYLQDEGIYKKTNSINTFKSTVKKSSSANAKKIRSLVSNAKKAGKNDTSAPTINLSTSNQNLTLSSNANTYVSSPIRVNSSTSSYNISFANAPSGTTYKISGGYLYVYVPASSVNNLKTAFNINVNNEKAIYKSYAYKPNKSTYQKMAVTYQSTKTANASLQLVLTKSINVPVNKIDSQTKEAISGAKLQVTNSSGRVIDSWTTDGNLHEISNLSAGTYTLTETVAPDGYVLNDVSVKFTVDNQGVIRNSNGSQVTTITFENTKNSVKISKQDITSKEELPGATLEVKDSSDKLIESWVSTNEPHMITGMSAGTYTLTETIAPDGYELSKKVIKFIIDQNGKLIDEKGNSLEKVVMYNNKEKDTGVEISKQDITTSKELPGASLTVVDDKNNIIDTWISTEESHIIKGISEGKYTLTETQAPDGYVLSTETIKFSIDENGNLFDEKGKEVDKVIMYNRPEEKNVKISKQDITTSKELPGASLEVRDSSGKVIESWVSTEEVHEIKDLAKGTYTLTEIQAPNGYVLSTETITFTVDENGNLTDAKGNSIDKVVMFNSPVPTSNVEISKKDITTSKELPGASLEVRDSSGKVIESWVSTEESHIIKGLTEGTYTLTEIQAPNGYVINTETITFKIDAKGQLTNNNGELIEKIVMYNEKEVIIPKVPIIKKDAKTNINLAGASLEVKDSSGKVIDSWVSTVEAHYIELTEGTYTLNETKAPIGYNLNNTPITFIVTGDGRLLDSNNKAINTVIMNNIPKEVITKVSISKQDITTKKEIPGAKLVIKDKDGNIIDSWTSTDKPYLITNLKAGEYTLNELIAPNGYVLSNETINFTVKADGSITSVVMYNTKKDTPITTNQTPGNSGQEIKVENTSSFKNVISSFIGGVAIIFGFTTITRKIKNKENY